jgi:hypothetical protein
MKKKLSKISQNEGHRPQPAAGGPGPQGQNEGRGGRSGLRSPYYDSFLSCQRAITSGSGEYWRRLAESAEKMFANLQIGRLIFYEAINFSVVFKKK